MSLRVTFLLRACPEYRKIRVFGWFGFTHTSLFEFMVEHIKRRVREVTVIARHEDSPLSRFLLDVLRIHTAAR
jgi:hypothetical protein